MNAFFTKIMKFKIYPLGTFKSLKEIEKTIF